MVKLFIDSRPVDMSDPDSQEESSQLLGRTDRTVEMEARYDHQLQKTFRLFHGITVVFGLTLIVLMLVWIFYYLGGLAWSSNPKVQFNWHPLLMTIGMVFLYAQAMMIYRFAREAKKRTLKLWHASIHSLVVILSIIGLKAAFDSHNLADPPIPNMYSLHSWIGLTTVLLFMLQFLSGFISFLFPGLPMEFRIAYMHVHISFGITGFLLALITALLGLGEKTFFQLQFKYSQLYSEALLINFIGITLITFGALSLYLINEMSYKRFPLPEDDMLLSPTAQPDIAE